MNNFRVFSDSAKGIMHENQDVGLAKVKANHAYLIVSDGHGGKDYIRSHIGAKHAVLALEAIFNDFASNYKNFDSINHAEQTLKEKIITSWRKLTIDHYINNPLPSYEIDPYKLYGATLLGVLLKDDYMVVIQIGDGNILALLENEDIVQYFKKDKKLVGNETTSICEINAIKDLHVKIVKLNVLPILIMVTTDGVINSFTDINDFYSLPKEVVMEIKSLGFNKTCQNFRQLLNDMVNKGSGDDCTVAILYNFSPTNFK